MDYDKRWVLSEKQTGYNVNQLCCFTLTITYKACMMIAVLVSRNITPFDTMSMRVVFACFQPVSHLIGGGPWTSLKVVKQEIER